MEETQRCIACGSSWFEKPFKVFKFSVKGPDRIDPMPYALETKTDELYFRCADCGRKQVVK